MSDGEEVSEDEQRLVKEIDKEINKLKYFLEETEELIEIKDYTEMEIVNKRAGNIITNLSDLVSQTEELKIERGLSPRSVRQWKKDIKSKYAALVNENERLRKCLGDREEEITRRKEDLKRNQQIEDERRLYELRERQQQHEREWWKEKLEGELRVAEKKLEMEKTAVSSSTKLPKLKITPFKGTAGDWVRFENMFLSQVDAKSISDEEKFGYLLESVGPKVRDRIANLKPGTVGYKTAWDRLKKEYGQTKVVINAHMDEIINLFPVKGSNYFRVQEFYEKLSRNYDALQTLEEGQKLQGFVMTTLNKLPHVKPDLVRVDENWEEWSMEDLIDALQKWLRRNHVENSKCEKHLFTEKGDKQTPYCLFCRKQDHWSVNCTVVTALADRKKFFVDRNLCFNCGRSNHRADQCRRRGCVKRKYRHHTSICDRQEKENNSSPNGVSLTYRIHQLCRRESTTCNYSREHQRTSSLGLPGHGIWTQFHLKRGSQVVKVKAHRSRDARNLNCQRNQTESSPCQSLMSTSTCHTNQQSKVQ